MSDILDGIPEREACLQCGLWKKTERYCASSYGPMQPDLFLVTSKLHEHEAAEGSFMSDEAGRWVMQQVQASGLTYRIDAVVKCASARPTPKQQKLCSEEFLLGNIKESRPRIIFCFGLEAAKAVLGTTLPLPALTKAGVLEGPDGIPVVVVDHPSYHSAFKEDQFNGNDLRPAYERAWYQIDSILRRGWEKATIEWTVHKDVEQALLVCQDISLATPIFSWDTEFGIQKNRNQSHHTTKLLSMGVGWQTPEGRYELHVFDMRDWDRSQKLKVIIALLAQSIIVSTFVKIDIQIAWFDSGYNAYGGKSGIHGLFDTGQIRWLLDQESWGNGLEDQAVQYCGAERWKHTTQDALNRIEAEATIPLEEGLEFYDYRHLDRDFCNEYQAWDVYWQARLWWEHYAQAENPCKLKPEFDSWAWKRTQAVTEFLCICERTGIVVDLDYMKLYENAMESKTLAMDEWIQSHPFVKHLQRTVNPDKPGGPVLDEDGNQKLGRDKMPKFEAPTMMVPESGFNPASTLMMRHLFSELGLEAKMKSPKTKAPKIDKRELLRQCGGVAVGVSRTGREKFFYAIMMHRSFKKQLASFIKPFTLYAVPAREGQYGYEPGQMRVHTQFKMSKVEAGQGGTDDIIEGGVDTGRNSSADPCISNMDKKAVFREAFPAPNGLVFWEVDQSSVEPRVLAYNANCESWMELFELKDKDPDNPDADLYRVEWAKFERANGKPWMQPGDVSDEDRGNKSKPLVLGGMYEASAQGVSGRENLPYDLCKAFMDSFWQGIPEILAYNAEVRRKVFAEEMVISTSGRKALFKLHGTYNYDHDKHQFLTLEQLASALDMKEDDTHIIRKAENNMTQGTAKDITDVLAIETVKYLKDRHIYWCALNNTVHDSLWGYCPPDKLEELYHALKKIGKNLKFLTDWGITFTTTRRVILDLDMKAGPSLGSMSKVSWAKQSATMRIPGLF